jgi:sarcosine oxidase/L-pipecolate oxidase
VLVNWILILFRYTDSFDGDFIIARVAGYEDIIVATGGSGHGFKFAPVIGKVVVDVIFKQESKLTHKFRWRCPDATEKKEGMRATCRGGLINLDSCTPASKEDLKAARFSMKGSKL